MYISLKSRRSVITPRLDEVKDPIVAQILNDFAKVISDVARNSYDDFTQLALQVVVDTVYLGDINTDGSWRFIKSGNNLSIQRRESGIWVEKTSITP